MFYPNFKALFLVSTDTNHRSSKLLSKSEADIKEAHDILLHHAIKTISH